jgi:hypothetical protein
MSQSPCDQKMSVYVLLKSDKIYLLQTKLGILLYVVNIRPVYFVEVSQGGRLWLKRSPLVLP